MKKITYYHVYNGSIFGDKNDPSTRDFLFTDEKEAQKCVYHLNAPLDSGAYTYRELTLTLYDSVSELDNTRVNNNPMNHRILDRRPIDHSSKQPIFLNEKEYENE